MAPGLASRLLYGTAYYALAVFTYILLFYLSVRSGSYFRKPSEKDKTDLALGL
jgi:hypothetical protein